MALAVALGATACSTAPAGGEGRGSERDLVAAGELCDGIFSARAAAALEKATGEKEFARDSAGDGLEEVVQQITDEYDLSAGAPDAAGETHDLCLVRAGGHSDLADVRIEFGLASRKVLGEGDPSPSYTDYGMGRSALASERNSMVFFDCVSPVLNTPEDSPALVMGELVHRHPPDAGGQAVSDANMTVLHSAALAVARELKCEKDGGLPAEPNLKPAP